MKGRALFTNSRVAKCDKKLTLCTSDAILVLKGYTNKCWLVTGKAELESIRKKRGEREKSREKPYSMLYRAAVSPYRPPPSWKHNSSCQTRIAR